MDPTSVAVGAAGVAVLASSSGASEATGTGRRMLFVDTYHDASPKMTVDKWRNVMTTGDLKGAIIKASDGTGDPGKGWFPANWKMLHDTNRERIGVDWFCGAYHFLRPGKALEQAERFLAQLELGGGLKSGVDMRPFVDVERGSNEGSAQYKATAQQWIDTCSEFAAHIQSWTGQPVILYGRGCMRDLKITSKMGCSAVWNPSWTSTMVRNGLEAWTLDDIVLWQYAGDGVGKLPGYPLGCNELGIKCDMSVYVDGARAPTMDSFRARVVAL